MTPADPAAFIRAHLPIEAAPGLPDLRLRRATPESGVGRWAAERGSGPPYWAYPWAGGLALARFVLERPETVAGRRVVDLGAGSGLVAIAAARAGAAHVLAVDIDPLAIAATRLNAAANGVAVTPMLADMTEGPAPEADLLLAGDVFYDPAVTARMIPLLERCVEAGLEVLVGDPWRAPLPIDRLRELARYQVAEIGGATRVSGVFAFGAAIR